MATLVHACARARVFDDVLDAGQFDALLRHLNGLRYTSVHTDHWHTVWRLHDGNPLKGRAGWYEGSAASADRRREPTFPTGTAMDPLVHWIADRAPELEAVVGAPRAWKSFSFAPWIYPPGSGLSLHEDGTSYTGAFTYFAHRRWNLYWGGHLMILDERTRRRDGEPRGFLDDQHETERVFDPGLAQTILPKPNRIVFIAPDAPHLVTRVDANAGHHPRVSIAGFFHKRSAAPAAE